MFRAALIRVATGAGLAAAMVSAPALAEVSQEATIKVWEVDMSGRPPYQRKLVEVPAIDAASMETNAPVETVMVRTVDFRGAPPFRRTTREVPVIDAASLEADIQSEVQRAVKAKPFFKPRHH